jgi:hypothetical protein
MKFLLKVAPLLLFLSSAQAGTVVATNINDPANDVVVANMSASALSGTIVAVGWYNAGFDVDAAAAANNFAALSSASNFNVLTSTLTGETSDTFGSDIAGYYITSNQDYGSPTAQMLASPQLYVLFGNAATLAGANTQYALVRFNESINADTPIADSNTLQLSGGSYTILSGTTGTAIVDLSSIEGSSTESNTSLQLVAIPEPGAALLSAIGMMGLFRRRRVMA